MKLRFVLLSFLVSLPTVGLANTPGNEVVPDTVQKILSNRCMACHDSFTAEGEVRLDEFATLELQPRLALMNRVRDQIFFGLMPPQQADPLSESESKLLENWLRGELQKHNASELDEKLRYPNYANYVDHEALFSGEVTEKPFTPARRWLVSPQIFQARVIDVFGLTDRERIAYANGRTFYGVTNPFVLPERSGVRYYDLETLNGGHLLVMLDNAKWIASKQIRAARVKNGEIAADEYPDAKDRWAPSVTPPEFEQVILLDTPPTDEQLIVAIRKQFDLVLQRSASEDEVARYLKLTRDAIELSGNTEGLQQMLVAVLLESEFLYRLEFGSGPPDDYGRKLLSPREAAYAISYALGDRNPDPELRLAAQAGRLKTRADYRREVERLLADETYYRGQVDPALNGKHYSSNETSHPRLVRFFRDFFGYPACVKVFKDGTRALGKYSNPDRGTLSTPGWLTLEADLILTRHVEKDEQVFEKLLTFEEFIVYPHKDEEGGKQIIAEWQTIYEKLKDSAWRTKPNDVYAAHQEFLQAFKLTKIRQGSELVNYMHYFDETFGKGSIPFTRVPWGHGYTYHHSIFYSLPPTPTIGRYGHWKSTKYEENVEPQEFWNYPTKQPFKIENRKGILTHPAWLIAHSTNFHTNPITRGRWIREKLLAGLVPDVPITVDAQVPEDPHKTFRQRVELVTKDKKCAKCHVRMNPLGLAFEMFDDFGRYRTEEALEDPENLIQPGNGKSTFDTFKTAPVVTSGKLTGTENPQLDGEVDDALELIDRLAQSERVRQSIIRHAFRFFLGRNEMLSDSQTLIEADRAYVESGGSFKAVVVSLLTSDSFMYRKEMKD